MLAAIVFSNSTHAQQDSASLDEVVITANKYPNKTSLTGKVVTIITKEQLEKNGGKDLSQILMEQTGLYIGGANSNFGKDKSIYLLGAAIQYTLITIDGVPVYDASGIGSNFDLRNLSADQIERIEIVKGSQSTLYGSDALAGVINIITKKSFAKKIEANGLISYGSNNSFKANIEAGEKAVQLITLQLIHTFLQKVLTKQQVQIPEQIKMDIPKTVQDFLWVYRLPKTSGCNPTCVTLIYMAI